MSYAEPVKGCITLEEAIRRVNTALTQSLNDEWTSLGDKLGVTWDDLKTVKHSENLDDRILYMLQHWLNNTKEGKMKKLSAAVQELNRDDLLSIIKTTLAQGKQDKQVIGELEKRMTVEWIALWMHLNISWDPVSGIERTNLKLTDKIYSGFDGWLRDGSQDFEEKMMVLSTALQKISRGDLIASLPTAESIVEDPLILSFIHGEANILDNPVLIRISTKGYQLKRKWLMVTSVDPATVSNISNATYVSNIIQVSPDDTIKGLTFKESVELYIPYHHKENKDEYELKLMDLEDGREWKECEYKVEDDNYLSIQRNSFSDAFTLVAVARLIVNEMTVSKEGGELRSTVENKAVMKFPQDAFETENTVQLQVEKTVSIEHPVEGVKQLNGLSPLMHIDSPEESSKPINMSLPMRAPDGSSLTGSFTNLNLVTSVMDGPWEPLAEVKPEYSKGIVSFSTTIPTKSSSYMVMSTPHAMDGKGVADLAEEVDETLHSFTVVMLLRQHHANQKKAWLQLCQVEELDAVIAKMAARGYTQGPDTESCEFRIKDKQKLVCYFSEGHIDFSGGGKHQMRFNSTMRSSQLNKYLEIKTKPKPKEIYGQLTVELVDDDGEKSADDINCELLVELPWEPEEPVNKPEEYHLTEEQIFKVLSNIRPDLLGTETTPQVSKPRKTSISSHRESPKETERKAKVKSAVNAIKRLPNVQKGWQPLAHQLGLSDMDILSLLGLMCSSEERVSKMLKVWAEMHGERATVQMLTDCLKKAKITDGYKMLDSPYGHFQ